MRTPLLYVLFAAACALSARANDPFATRDAQRKTVNVIGGVRAPGSVPWTADLTIVGAIERAGGIPWDNVKKVRLTRGADRTLIELRKIVRGEILEPKLQPGDTIEVPE